MANIVSARNLRKAYPSETWWRSFGKKKKDEEAVRGVSFDIKKGEIFGLLGPNGAGKTTTINMLTGVITPSSGTVQLFGKPLVGNEESAKQRMNLAAGHTRLNSKLTIYENLKVYSEIYGVENGDERIAALARKFGITDIMDRAFISTSSGQKTRTMLIKGLLNSPELLLLDEPTIGMDPDVAELTRATLLEEHERTGMTILLTSHYMSEVEELCDRVALMLNGKIFKIATPEQLRRLIQVKRVEFWFLRGQDESEALFRRKKMPIVESNPSRTVIEVPSSFTFDQILPEFSKLGVRVRTIHTHEPDLEDVFIKMSRGELR